MALIENQLEIVKILVEHYGYINSWEIDHWKNYHLLIEAAHEQCVYDYNLNNDDRIKYNRTKNIDAAVYEKEFQGLTLEAYKLFALTKKMKRIEGLEYYDKLCLTNKIMDDSLNLLDEGNSLMQNKIDNPRTFIPKKPLGRPSSKIRYRWMDYLVSELGSKKKAANYASDFPMIDYRNPSTLLREYRKYCKAKGEG
jgi:hypothetical protein